MSVFNLQLQTLVAVAEHQVRELRAVLAVQEL
jgi:hypothetical protein